jgi:succinyl-diaminopimelate desuccinylase
VRGEPASAGGGHHGPDEWVSIDSLALYRRALVDFARSVPERFADAETELRAVDGGLA